jgi:hypothetical protein
MGDSTYPVLSSGYTIIGSQNMLQSWFSWMMMDGSYLSQSRFQKGEVDRQMDGDWSAIQAELIAEGYEDPEEYLLANWESLSEIQQSLLSCVGIKPKK